MLKQVMMGAGGILLAAAIFASSITPGTVQADGATTPSPSTPPVVQAVPPVVSSSQPRSVFGEETGDIQFGAPMIPAEPQREVSTDPDPGPSVDQNGPANGRRTFAPRPGMPYPQPH
ncbi:hypothetical protein [Blastomonas sp. AAP53]|uniref:hypothetical protein n=1 Tax=Blastomonas sp. AAP53 TaxID=1248760 RepID=UPI0005912FDC|nr:hypothetical protein [Blastomonas sp. AAP53]